MALRLPDDFREFLRLLNDRHVEYLVIGGYAVSCHGYPRATQDLDIWVAMDPTNASRVVAVLREFGFDVPGLCDELFLTDRSLVRLGHPPLRIEICTTIDGVQFGSCYARRTVTTIDGVTANVLSRDDLIANKLASGRHRDLDDLEHLMDGGVA